MQRVTPLVLALLIAQGSLAQCTIGNLIGNNLQSGTNTVGQSFTATCGGTIEYVEFFSDVNGTSTAGTLKIYSGSTVSNTPIHTQPYEAIPVTSGGPIRVYLDQPITVVNGNVRTFEMDVSVAVLFSQNNPYPGGRFFLEDNQHPLYPQIDMRFNVSIFNDCVDSSSEITEISCGPYTSPSGLFWTESGTYMDTIPNLAGCDSILTIDLTLIEVDTGVTQIGNTLISNAAEATYEWVDCNNGFGPIDGANEQIFLAEMNGSFAAIVAQNGCIDTTACYTVISTAIGSREHDLAPLHPNPSDGLVLIDQPASIEKIDVFTPAGKLILTHSSSTGRLDLGHLPAGMYLIRLHRKNGASDQFRVMME